MKCRDKSRTLGSCIISFALGIIIASLLPWVAVSVTLAVISVISGILLYCK